MAPRKVQSVSRDGQVATIYRDPEYNEFVVRLKGRPQADYFTSDKSDALATARRMVGYTGPRKLARLGLGGLGNSRVRFSCSKAAPIIRQIVGRLHVGTPDAEVAEYAASKLKKGASAATIRAVKKCAVKEHHKNRKLYTDVMGGRIR